MPVRRNDDVSPLASEGGTGQADAARAEGPLGRGLHLVALCSFAVAQPLLDVLGLHPDFFTARHSSPWELAWVALVLLLLPAVLLWTLERGVGLFSGWLECALHRGLVALLVALTVLPPLGRAALPAVATFGLAAMLGVAAAVGYARLKGVRSTATWLALAPVVFAAAFFSRDGVVMLMLRGEAPLVSVGPIERPAPIVFVVFDELPVTSLLDERGGVDSSRYPNFARLARRSLWLRSATSIDSMTLQAMPAILTGMLPGERRRPATASAHPRNLFRALGSHYAMHVVEPLTMLYRYDSPEGGENRLNSLASDLAVVYLHVLLPWQLAERLPPIDVGWGSFVLPHQELSGRAAAFRRFVASIEKQEQPAFHFLHSGLPHSPWYYLPSGRVYAPFDWFMVKGRFLPDPAWSIEAWQRHLLQVGFVDRLLGELLDRLEEVGLYDECLLVVTSDHGMSFWPGQHFRSPVGHRYPEDVLGVPFFIKLPRQQRGSVSWRNVESIDIVPSIAHAIGLQLPWNVDGCSVFDESCPDRLKKVTFEARFRQPHLNRRFELDPDIVLRPDTLRRKIGLFGTGSTPGGLHRFGPYARLVGRRVEELGSIGTAPGGAVLAPMKRKLPIGREEQLVPARVMGFLEMPDDLRDRVHVAVAVGGIVRTVVAAPVFKDRHRLAAMIPEAALEDEEAERTLYLVKGSPESPVLQLLPSALMR